eukprot:CAMPEP_0201581990 /NCGR_PEP_ID=MMETSP0190_2-20130828/78362_1 /ASSEMBLY_ACC=CAM_ASM_000263 /TAXON_ID=37353 /ORGANISM="Rosalina sp." /LENGTH=190 /DNA_ID=CAMNT_0048021025 /DNA_START=136 /DNA_END=708 /DNA_ORIENTATION=-
MDNMEMLGGTGAVSAHSHTLEALMKLVNSSAIRTVKGDGIIVHIDTWSGYHFTQGKADHMTIQTPQLQTFEIILGMPKDAAEKCIKALEKVNSRASLKEFIATNPQIQEYAKGRTISDANRHFYPKSLKIAGATGNMFSEEYTQSLTRISNISNKLFKAITAKDALFDTYLQNNNLIKKYEAFALWKEKK